ncbi:MAG: aminotransferase [Bacteroidetes bacterium GWF2_49_14]|nr:MAG: aminotransferase [Bacteroidetes bacterium GWF2_49_14]HBB90854.1 aminotransferase [Bacteroidales bacterium]
MVPITPIDSKIVREQIALSRLPDLGHASIREIVRLVNKIEQESGEKFIRMEMGVPGLEPPEIGIEAEIAALHRGVASKYPDIEGVPELKREAQRFVKLFLDLEIPKECCIPTVGSMQGAMAAFMVANRSDRTKLGTLFIDPGFPVQKQQCRVLGHDFESFDVYDYRGEKLGPKLDSYLSTGKISTLLYSNPNNPSWICFTEDELKTIGTLAKKYDVIVIEDLAYFGMDFRKDYSQPGQPPYQPTVARYCDHWLLLISSSKAFSFAGERVGCMIISELLFNRTYPDLKRYYTSDRFGHSMIFGALYALSSGVCHSAQYGLAAMMKAANDGEFNFVENVKEYGRRAHALKEIFTNNGFTVVYDRDIDDPIADGFYFTVSYPGMTGSELLQNLLFYGVSAISLTICGSTRTEGLRACVSQIHAILFPVLEERLEQFNRDYKDRDA